MVPSDGKLDKRFWVSIAAILVTVAGGFIATLIKIERNSTNINRNQSDLERIRDDVREIRMIVLDICKGQK